MGLHNVLFTNTIMFCFNTMAAEKQTQIMLKVYLQPME